MCLAIPMKIIRLDGHSALCISRGIEREVNCFMLNETPLAVGDYLLVHVGYAIQKVDRDEARLIWEVDRAMADSSYGTHHA